MGKPSSVEDLVESVTRGNVTEVKVVLASVVVALAVYQVCLMTVAYGRVRLSFLAPKPAFAAHRAVGDAIVVITAVVAVMCLSYFGFEDAAAHTVVASCLIAVLALKIMVVRRWHRMSRFLPALGISVFALFVATWVTAAADHVVG